MKVPTLIAGGGLAGLSCARELAKASSPYLLVEREADPGGLCRSILEKGFTFDYTGHFLHFQKKEIEEWVGKLLSGKLKKRKRHAVIYSHGTYSEYPYQENNAGLPSGVALENVRGYLEALLAQRFLGKDPGGAAHFLDWCGRAFGPGLSKNFMVPYNRKLWKYPLDRLTTHWMGRFVPKARIGEVLQGALRRRPSASGYNATFLYPDQGGISVLPRAIAEGLPRLWTRTSLERVDLSRRRARLSNGLEVGYDRLVSSLPLPRLAALCSPVPAGLARAARALQATSIYNVNLGFRGPQPIPYSWVYFPGEEFAFHRAGSVSSCVPTVAPRGHFSLYVEFSYRGRKPDPRDLGRKALSGLRDLGWIRGAGNPVARVDLDLPGAYVLYDRHRESITGQWLSYLAKRGVHSIGRYGRWEYGSMESALDQGLGTAKAVLRGLA